MCGRALIFWWGGLSLIMRIECNAYEQATASMICCGDKDGLCKECDIKVHMENILASKHKRFPLDIMHFGENDYEKSEKLVYLMETMNSSEKIYIVHVPIGPNVLTYFLISYALFTRDGEVGSGFVADTLQGGKEILTETQ